MKYFRWILYLFFVFLLSLSSCKQHQISTEIYINIQNIPQTQMLSLIRKSADGPAIVLDTVLIKKEDGESSFKTLLDPNAMYSLRFESDGRSILFTNDEPVIRITADWNAFPEYSISSPASNTLRLMLAEFNKRLQKIDSLQLIMNQNASDSLKQIWKADLLKEEQEKQDYLKRFSDTTQSAVLALYALGILQQEVEDMEIMEPVINRLANRFPENKEVKTVKNTYTALLEKQKSNPEVGRMAPLFSLPDTADNEIALQSFRGKYTLVDFWASWCAPCRTENPNIVRVFNQYKDRNFSILGVSLDKNKAAWTEAIHADGLAWSQVSDLKEWESSVVPLYQIEGIPFNVLLDPDGKIIAMNLRGDELGRKLASIFEVQEP
ncbi:MAG: AhpC/TSA family protein [Chitinophagaceae bacterium]|nr:AhpC/TSA family protein [Chitinophagaceae bacterium]